MPSRLANSTRASATFDPLSLTTFAPGTRARAQHLRDEQEFIAASATSKKHCRLKPVSFIKPIGAENEHPGYTNESAGSSHLVDLIKAIEGSACKNDTLVVSTYDEFGGQWDHVTPPGQGGNDGVADQWGPGTRIPALVISPNLNGDFVVDHVPHDAQADAGAAHLRVNGASPAVERLEDVGQIFGRDSRTIVHHHDPHRARGGSVVDPHRSPQDVSALGRELERIAQQIGEHLLERRGIE